MTRTVNTLKTFILAAAVTALAGCNENAKDCGGFWDKTFGREACTTAADMVKVSSITPDSALVGNEATFTLLGERLSGVALSIPDCTGLKVTQQLDTKLVAMCTPALAGSKTLSVKNGGGAVIFQQPVEFFAPAPADAVVKSAVVAINKADEARIAVVAPVTSVADPETDIAVTFNSPSPELAALPVGQVMIFPKSSRFPFGFAGKVTEVSGDATAKTLSFARVGLGDVFEELDVSAVLDNPDDLSEPVFYPALLKPEGNPAPSVPAAKSVISTKAVRSVNNVNIVKFTPAWDATTKTFSLGVAMPFAVAALKESGSRTYKVYNECPQKDATTSALVEFSGCLKVTPQAKFELANIQFQSSKMKVSQSKIKNAEVSFTATTGAEFGYKLETGTIGSNTNAFKLSAKDMIDAFFALGAKKDTIRLGGQSGYVGEIKGVEWDEDRIALGSLVFSVKRTATTGIPVDTPQGGYRDVSATDVQIFITLFMTAKGELVGELETKLEAPKLGIGAGLKIDDNVISAPDNKNFVSVREGTILSMSGRGSMKASASAGVAVGLGVLGIVPWDTTYETGVAFGMGGQFEASTKDGWSGCQNGMALTWGSRLFTELGMSAEVDYIKSNGEVVPKGKKGIGFRLGIYNDNEVWDEKNIIKQIAEDTCHAPAITKGTWLGGNFDANVYPMVFDGSATGYQPQVRSLEWDFGDGQKKLCSGVDLDACYVQPHQYSAPGKYTVLLKAVYDDETFDTFSYGKGIVSYNISEPPSHVAKWDVDIKPPRLNMELTPASGLAALLEICATCVDGATGLEVDWGDGSSRVSLWSEGDGVRLRHVYTSTGDRTVKVTFNDRFGNTFSKTQVVNVQATFLSIMGNKVQQAGEELKLWVQGGFNDIVSVVWDFVDDVGDAVTGFGEQLVKVFDRVGDYVVRALGYDVDNNLVADAQDTVHITEAQRITGVTPGVVVRTVPATLVLQGLRLPSHLRVSGDNGAVCGSPVNPSETSFSIGCTFPNMGSYVLTVFNADDDQVVGSATVQAQSNVTAVKWGVNNGTVKFGDTVSYTVEGINLTGGMGFAVEKCGASNTEVGTGTDSQRTFRCLFNNEAGALAGLMPGVVKDQPDGLVLFSFTVPVEVAVQDGGGKLNDTGITVCWDSSTILGDCATANLGLWADLNQDGQNGRDALAAKGQLTKVGSGSAGFDFTKIGANGEVLPADAASWDCVLDNHTGLMWEVKTTDGGLRDWRKRYGWYNPDASTNGGWESRDYGGNNTFAFVNAVNAQSLCGHNDWRLPDRMELTGLVDYSKPPPGPTIDTAYFPNTALPEQPYDFFGGYWTSAPCAQKYDRAWGVNFGNGSSGDGYQKYSFSYVRVVRSSNNLGVWAH